MSLLLEDMLWRGTVGSGRFLVKDRESRRLGRIGQRVLLHDD